MFEFTKIHHVVAITCYRKIEGKDQRHTAPACAPANKRSTSTPMNTVGKHTSSAAHPIGHGGCHESRWCGVVRPAAVVAEVPARSTLAGTRVTIVG